LAQKTNTSVWLFVFLTPSLLPRGDEFRMNSEGLDVFFRHIYCFPQHSFELGVNFAEKGRPGQWGPKTLHRAGPRGLGYGGAIIRLARY
jgi:hypothetical protein